VLLEQFESTNLKLKNSLLTGVNLQEGQPQALLVIPSIGVRQVVVKGTSSTDMLAGPGLMPDTALPGPKEFGHRRSSQHGWRTVRQSDPAASG